MASSGRSFQGVGRSSLPLLRGWLGIGGGGEQCIVITNILFLFSILVNILSQPPVLLGFFSPILSPVPLGRGEVNKQLCGAEPPARLTTTGYKSLQSL